MDDLRQRNRGPAAHPHEHAHAQPAAAKPTPTSQPAKHTASLYGRFMRRVGQSFGSTMGLFCMLLVFTVCGAIMFIAVEGPNEGKVRFMLTKERQKTIQLVKKLAGASKDLTKFMEQLDRYRDQLTDAFSQGVTSDGETDSKWTFWGGVFYCLTVYTTIGCDDMQLRSIATSIATCVGYGNIFPTTTVGKLLTLLYSIVGIPLCLIVLARLGKILTRILRSMWTYPRLKISGGGSGQQEPVSMYSVYSQSKEEFDFPIVAALSVTLVYLGLGALLYGNWETWSYLDAVYFIFVSISTIGFGDILPQESYFFLLSSLYIFFGLALVSMVLNVIMEEMERKVSTIQTHLESTA